MDELSLRAAENRPMRLLLMLGLVWFSFGVALIWLDSVTEPCLHHIGTDPVVHLFASHWQDLGATFGIVAFLLAGFIPMRRDRGETFAMFALTIASAGVIVQIIKHLIGRARPNFVHDQTHFYGPFGILYHGPRIQMDSMPSGHTTAAFAMAFALSCRWPRFRWVWILIALGVAIARTLVDRHFPSDVVVGAWLGMLVGWAACKRCRGWFQARRLQSGG